MAAESDENTHMEPQIVEHADGQRFVKVRVAVAVWSNGRWIADGYYNRTAKWARAAVSRHSERGCGVKKIHYVYALVPVHDEWDETGGVVGGEVTRDFDGNGE
jgi:hypothetical protein